MSRAHAASSRLLLLVYVALMALLALTWGISFVDLGPLNVPVALAIAVAKALLVLLFYMELKGSSKLVDLAAALGFCWLAILLTLTFADYLTRGPG